MSEIRPEEMLLISKVRNIQSELKAPKNLWNDYGKYKYRNAESILEALKPLQQIYRVMTVLNDEIIQIGNRFYIKSTATIHDCDSDQTISAVGYAREDETKKGMDGSQITGSCSSYARKYALSSLLLLDDSTDLDSSDYQNQDKQKKTGPTPTRQVKKAEERTPTPAKPSEPVETSNSIDGINYRAELRKFLVEKGIDPKTIVEACGLKPTSTNAEWQAALEYAKNLTKEGGEKNG